MLGSTRVPALTKAASVQAFGPRFSANPSSARGFARNAIVCNQEKIGHRNIGYVDLPKAKLRLALKLLVQCHVLKTELDDSLAQPLSLIGL